MVKDFVENNNELKQIESICRTIGRYNEFQDEILLQATPRLGTPNP